MVVEYLGQCELQRLTIPVTIPVAGNTRALFLGSLYFRDHLAIWTFAEDDLTGRAQAVTRGERDVRVNLKQLVKEEKKIVKGTGSRWPAPLRAISPPRRARPPTGKAIA